MKYVESSSGSSHSVQYGYDDINNLTSLVETINGTAHTTSYAYDDDNRLTTVTNGSVSKTYGYDADSRVSGRTTKYGTSTILTDTLTYMIPMSNQGTTGQVGSLRSQAAGYDVTYTYNYDGNGNILYISDGTNITLYAYDSANQLIRENNQAANKTWVWTYDDGGNITSRTEYPYSTGGLGTATATVNYTYDTSWGDLLTGYNGQTISSDTIGNMLSDGTWTYTWEHGRELATMSNGTTTWTYTYNADGMRTSRSNGTTAYSYVYNGSSLSQMTVGSDTLYFAYDASTPMSVTYNGSTYYYVTNLQGDVTAILNTAGAPVVTYTYDAWGNILSANGTMADSLGTLNPLRYRSYVYDHETGLYYLQSRYYDPELGRFINADGFAATGKGIVGNNMFAYCNNNPVLYIDSAGNLPMLNKVLRMSDGGGHDSQYQAQQTKKMLEELSADEIYYGSAAITISGSANNNQTTVAVESSLSHGFIEATDSINSITDMFGAYAGGSIGFNGASYEYGAYLFKETIQFEIWADAKMEVGVIIGVGKEKGLSGEGVTVGGACGLGGFISIIWDDASKTIYIEEKKN